MNNLGPNKFQTIILTSLILAFLIGVGLVWPRYEDLSLLKSLVKEKEEKFQEEKEYFSKLTETKAKLKDYAKALEKLSAALPDTPSLPSLFNFIQRASSQTGLVLKGISPFTVAALEGSALKETKVSFELVGSYSSLKSFIFVLENSARLVEVENIAFVYPKENNPFTFNLRIKVLSY